MSTDHKFYRAIYTVEVLSKDPPPSLSDVCLSLLHEQAKTGESVVVINADRHYTLTAGQMREALAMLGVRGLSLFGLPGLDAQDPEGWDCEDCGRGVPTGKVCPNCF